MCVSSKACLLTLSTHSTAHCVVCGTLKIDSVESPVPLLLVHSQASMLFHISSSPCLGQCNLPYKMISEYTFFALCWVNSMPYTAPDGSHWSAGQLAEICWDQEGGCSGHLHATGLRATHCHVGMRTHRRSPLGRLWGFLSRGAGSKDTGLQSTCGADCIWHQTWSKEAGLEADCRQGGGYDEGGGGLQGGSVSGVGHPLCCKGGVPMGEGQGCVVAGASGQAGH